jgi:uncharacterized protein YgiM (DUF1202 family)
MNRRLLLIGIVWISLCAIVHATEFPYTAYVTSDDVYVRSGPGKNYYPTTKLKRGAKVEVYRHDPGGWYAIRPPAESFSWVAARNLELGEEGLAEVNAERTVARVGSLFSDVREVIQIRLKKGEQVGLIEEAVSSDGKWYKIEPPSGEFRWVYRDYVDRVPPEGEEYVEDEEPEDRRPVKHAIARSSRDDDDEV